MRMKRIPYCMTSASLEKKPIRGCAIRNTNAPSAAVAERLMSVAVRIPSRARFGCPAPQFCPTKVVEAMLMLCTGMSAKASILLYTPNLAMQAEPK